MLYACESTKVSVVCFSLLSFLFFSFLFSSFSFLFFSLHSLIYIQFIQNTVVWLSMVIAHVCTQIKCCAVECNVIWWRMHTGNCYTPNPVSNTTNRKWKWMNRDQWIAIRMTAHPSTGITQYGICKLEFVLHNPFSTLQLQGMSSVVVISQ